MKMMKETKN